LLKKKTKSLLDLQSNYTPRRSIKVKISVELYYSLILTPQSQDHLASRDIEKIFGGIAQHNTWDYIDFNTYQIIFISINKN